METLTNLLYNSDTDCSKKYTIVSQILGDRLKESLEDIEKFYYSDFWTYRFKRRLKEEKFEYNPIHLDIILGSISSIKDDTVFKVFNESNSLNGVSNTDTMIALNTNMTNEKLNDSHINNVIMYEFGHRQYNQKEFNLIIELNKSIINTPGLYIKNNQVLIKKDYSYFTNHNEIRQRIIPIIKEMYDNNWNPYEVYDYSENLKLDDIKDIFTKKYIINLIEDIL